MKQLGEKSEEFFCFPPSLSQTKNRYVGDSGEAEQCFPPVQISEDFGRGCRRATAVAAWVERYDVIFAKTKRRGTLV